MILSLIAVSKHCRVSKVECQLHVGMRRIGVEMEGLPCFFFSFLFLSFLLFLFFFFLSFFFLSIFHFRSSLSDSRISTLSLLFLTFFFFILLAFASSPLNSRPGPCNSLDPDPFHWHRPSRKCMVVPRTLTRSLPHSLPHSKRSRTPLADAPHTTVWTFRPASGRIRKSYLMNCHCISCPL